MYPTIVEIGPVKLYAYGLMIALGFLLALFFMRRDGRRAGIDPDVISEMAFWSLFLGIVGTRLLHIIMFSEHYSWTEPLGWIAVWRGGLVFHGAIPPVLIYVYFALKKHKLSFLTMSDIVMPYVPLAHAFGRMGCFLRGCCFGQRADGLPWAIRFPKGSPAYFAHVNDPGFNIHENTTSFPVHPTQLYSVAGLLLTCAILLLLRSKWRPYVGFTFPLYLIFYGIQRFIVEIFRGDGNPTWGIFSNQQVFCIVMVVFGAALFVYLGKRSAAIPADGE